jgi:EpsI family protein
MTTEKRFAFIVRFVSVWLILAGTALFLNARNSFEKIPEHKKLENFPHELQGWQGADSPIGADVLQVLGPGEFLSRTYRNATAPEIVDLFVAYYASQRSGDTIHSPQNCLPGSGWTPLRQDYIRIASSDASNHEYAATANRFVFAKGMDRVFVLYWYQAHGRTTPSEYWAKFYLVRDSIAMNRSDGAMVRIATPIINSSDEAQAEARAVKFAQVVLGELEPYIPR